MTSRKITLSVVLNLLEPSPVENEWQAGTPLPTKHTHGHRHTKWFAQDHRQFIIPEVQLKSLRILDSVFLQEVHFKSELVIYCKGKKILMKND